MGLLAENPAVRILVHHMPISLCEVHSQPDLSHTCARVFRLGVSINPYTLRIDRHTEFAT